MDSAPQQQLPLPLPLPPSAHQGAGDADRDGGGSLLVFPFGLGVSGGDGYFPDDGNRRKSDVYNAGPKGDVTTEAKKSKIVMASMVTVERSADARWWQPRVILPHEKWYMQFWYCCMFLALLNAVLDPYKLAFEVPGGFEPYYDVFTIIEYISIVFFAADIVLKFFVAYMDEEKHVFVTDLRAIQINFISKMFWFDLLFWFPFSSVINQALTHSQPYPEYDTQEFVMLLNWLKLGRLYRVFVMFAHLDHEMIISQISLMLISRVLLRNFFYILMTCHWFACAFYFLARAEGFTDGDSWVGRAQAYLRFENKPAIINYINAIYLSINLFAGLGDGDFYVATAPETILTVIYLLFNVVLGAYILGTVTMLMVKGDERMKAYRDRVTTLKEYVDMNEVPTELHTAMAQHLELQFMTEQISDDNVLRNYPLPIRRRVLRQLYLDAFQECDIMAGCKAKFLDALLASCKTNLFMPNVQLVLDGDTVDNLCMIVDGEVEVFRVTTDNSSSTGLSMGPGGPRSRLYSAGGSVDEGEDNGKRSRHTSFFGGAGGAAGGSSSMTGASSCASMHGGGEDGHRRARAECFCEIPFFTSTPSTEAVWTCNVVRVILVPRAAYVVVAVTYPNQIIIVDAINRNIAATQQIAAATGVALVGPSGMPHGAGEARSMDAYGRMERVGRQLADFAGSGTGGGGACSGAHGGGGAHGVGGGGGVREGEWAPPLPPHAVVSDTGALPGRKADPELDVRVVAWDVTGLVDRGGAGDQAGVMAAAQALWVMQPDVAVLRGLASPAPLPKLITLLNQWDRNHGGGSSTTAAAGAWVAKASPHPVDGGRGGEGGGYGLGAEISAGGGGWYDALVWREPRVAPWGGLGMAGAGGQLEQQQQQQGGGGGEGSFVLLPCDGTTLFAGLFATNGRQPLLIVSVGGHGARAAAAAEAAARDMARARRDLGSGGHGAPAPPPLWVVLAGALGLGGGGSGARGAPDPGAWDSALPPPASGLYGTQQPPRDDIALSSAAPGSAPLPRAERAVHLAPRDGGAGAAQASRAGAVKLLRGVGGGSGGRGGEPVWADVRVRGAGRPHAGGGGGGGGFGLFAERGALAFPPEKPKEAPQVRTPWMAAGSGLGAGHSVYSQPGVKPPNAVGYGPGQTPPPAAAAASAASVISSVLYGAGTPDGRPSLTPPSSSDYGASPSSASFPPVAGRRSSSPPPLGSGSSPSPASVIQSVLSSAAGAGVRSSSPLVGGPLSGGGGLSGGVRTSAAAPSLSGLASLNF
ncbi:hypothetical protein FOA52_007339 [Chlamydomonas sp. UWO 241]|nr:hypothetical protein FOA52_007339 [Chlamydomonas sp. UWO 241]